MQIRKYLKTRPLGCGDERSLTNKDIMVENKIDLNQNNFSNDIIFEFNTEKLDEVLCMC